MNMERDENKVPVRAGNSKVTIKGNVGASAGAINVNEPEPYTRVNLGLATPDSSWTGVAYNAFKDEGNDAGGKKFLGKLICGCRTALPGRMRPGANRLMLISERIFRKAI